MGEAMRISQFQPDKNFVRTSRWYVIFIKTFEEYRFAERLQSKLDSERYIVFVPTKDRSFRRKDVVRLHRVVLFPGYVFVASTVAPETCLETLKPIIMLDEVAYKLLGDEDDLQCAIVEEHDKALLMRLMNEEFHITAVEAVEVGDEVVIVNSVFEGYKGRAVKINKYRKTVDVEFVSDFIGDARTVTFALKVVEQVGFD